MNLKATILYLFTSICIVVNAQNTVTIPDANFASRLQQHVPNAIVGNQLDTAHIEVKSCYSMSLSSSSISDLSGIEFFGSLIYLYCDNNLLSDLPQLPKHLGYLDCSNNQITSIAKLPDTLSVFICSQNQLTSLPDLPNNLNTIYCNDNQLSSLPELPSNLYRLNCSSNNIHCFNYFPGGLNYGYSFLDISDNPIVCLPNYVSSMDNTTATYPLCYENDDDGNPYMCVSDARGITGYIFEDLNNNCKRDGGDNMLKDVLVYLYDNNNVVLESAYTGVNGRYHFSKTPGTYKIALDEYFNKNISTCSPGIDSVITITSDNKFIDSVNFSLSCPNTNDIAIRYIYRSGWVFPGQVHRLFTDVGSPESWYNLNCNSSSVGGQVQITVNGPVKYFNTYNNALMPTIDGNVFKYDIADFSNLNYTSFGLLFTTDTTAQMNDTICVNVEVTTNTPDADLTNNTQTYCYPVVNSYDPNIKEVYPGNVPPNYNDWLTYTIHFQNTGNAPAINIKLIDTLDAKLDLSTFQVLTYSHDNTTTLKGNKITVRFPNIWLVDSTTNADSSQGFIQYRIKPNANLAEGTQIKNTAYIYFDYNEPIITNTTINEFVSPIRSSVANIFKEDSDNINVYPNPSNGKFMITVPYTLYESGATIEVCNIMGSVIYNTTVNSLKTSVDLSEEADGIYFIKVKNKEQSVYKRIVKR
jgi:uncharacterized repeat protein (TIGR01451 family)